MHDAFSKKSVRSLLRRVNGTTAERCMVGKGPSG